MLNRMFEGMAAKAATVATAAVFLLLAFAIPVEAQIFNFGPTNTPIPKITKVPVATPSATIAPSVSVAPSPTGAPLSVTPTGPVRTIITGDKTGAFVTHGTDTVVLRDGTILYLGGAFTEVQLSTNASQLRNYLASANVPENRITDWNPAPDALVETMAIDNSKLYVGGQFTRIAGQERRYAASFDKASGNLTPWNPNANDYVYTIHVDNTFIWLGGKFTAIGNQNRLRISSFNKSTGEIDPFNPGADNEIYALAGNETTLYVGGAFTVIGGKERRYLAAIDKKTGVVTDWSPTVPNVVRKISISNEGKIVATGPTAAPTVAPGTPTAVPGSVSGAQTSFAAIIDPVTGQVTEIRTLTPTPNVPFASTATGSAALTSGIKVDQNKLGFIIPNLADILTFILRAFFVISGLVALLYLMLGAFSWITSGGDEENVKKARDKITAAIVGVILIVVVLAIVVTLEQIVFQSRICFGLSCAASIPNLIEPL